MATLRVTTRLRNETEGFERGKAATSVTTTGTHMQWERITVGTSEEELTINADITAGSDPGYAHFVNTDATNYVQVGMSTGAYFMRLKAGESAVLPLDPGITSLFLKANTASVQLEILIFER